jgi:thioester reductase-like protein
MPGSAYVLLTGATGLLGRYLLRDLLLSGRQVVVLVRDGAAGRAERRVAELVSSGAASVPAPVVLTGDLRDPGLGLGPADRAWLGRVCRAAVHAAANVALRSSFDGEPARTNAAGTRELVAACESLGIAEFHHVSTAYICGDRTGTVLESESDCGQGFRNEYERSKSEAERLVRAAHRLRPTIYRPSVIVGDSRTGFTSRYHGFYRFFDLAARMAEPDRDGARCLPLRLPFHGGEARNLVPVDWVSAAITRIVSRPELHGSTYHLTTREPTPVRDMKSVVEEVLGIGGTEFVGPGEAADPNDTERTFREQIREFLPYLGGDPVFDCRNTGAALPGFDAPRVDRPMLDRLIRFAVADGWGRRRRGNRRASTTY